MTKKLIAGGVILVALGAGLLWWQESSINSSRARMASEAPSSGPSVPRPASTPRVPAHFVVAPAAKSLAPTLPPEQFFGSARDGYVKAKEIAPTLAQLPCYCDCDLHMGHKSLHTCFETDHAANCSICLNEALLAYELQKKQGMSVEKIRERIIAEYSPRH